MFVKAVTLLCGSFFIREIRERYTVFSWLNINKGAPAADIKTVEKKAFFC